MALNLTAPFKRGGAFPIDEELFLSKAEMLTVNDNTMPEKYFCICKDDGQLYLYDKSATPSAGTGKYSLLEGGGGVFVAKYDQTSYADVVAAIDANKAIIVDFTNNHNLFCVTYSAYTAGQDAVMCAVFQDRGLELAIITVKPNNGWSISLRPIQEQLVSGTSIKTINGISLLGSGNIDVGGGEEGKTYTMDWDAEKMALTLTDGTTEQTLTLSGLQALLESGISIKTINGTSILGSGNIEVGGGGDDVMIFTPNVTTYAEMAAAIRTNKRMVCVVDDRNELTLQEVIEAIIYEDEYSPEEQYIIILCLTGSIIIRYGITPDNTWTTNSVIYSPMAAITDGQLAPVQGGVIKAYVDSKAGQNFEVGAEKWQGTYTDENGVTYQVYSKVVYIPALPDTAGITTYPHGITGIKQILSAYGFTTDGFVLNAPRQTVSDNISIYQVQKTGGIAIEVGKDRSSKKAYVVLTYAKNN